ncbi:amidohydrolase, partial [Listeria monocytogenes]
MRTQLMNMLQERKDEITQIRRHLHEHPELSFHETETANFIQDFYKGKDVEVATEVGNGHAVVVTIKGEKPGKRLRYVPNFDALPIEE